jgi:hypothetical protein
MPAMQRQPSTSLAAEDMMKVEDAREAAHAALCRAAAAADLSSQEEDEEDSPDVESFTIELSEVARHLQLENEELREFCASVRARCTGGQTDPLKCPCVVLNALNILLKLPPPSTFARCVCNASPSGVVH